MANNATFFSCATPYEQAGIVLVGAPYDSTASFRPGARFAPQAMRNDSLALETYSPYQDQDVEDLPLFDSGDLPLPFGGPGQAMAMIEAQADTIIKDGKLPVFIGGEHLISLGAIRAAYKHYPNLHILHFDAHTDLRDSFFGEALSHATVLRRAWDKLGDGRIWQFGIRSGEREEFLWAKEHTRLTKFGLDGLDEALAAIGDSPLYFTLDLDVLDPGYLPGTGTPEAGGVDFPTLLKALIKLGRMNIVGCDITELSPPCDISGASTALACKVLRELLLSVNK